MPRSLCNTQEARQRLTDSSSFLAEFLQRLALSIYAPNGLKNAGRNLDDRAGKFNAAQYEGSPLVREYHRSMDDGLPREFVVDAAASIDCVMR